MPRAGGIHALLQRRAAEFSGFVGQVLEDRGGLAEMAPVRIVDEQRHLAEALLRKILRPLVLALAQIDVHVIERFAGERQEQADLVGRTGGPDSMKRVACGHGTPLRMGRS